MNDDRVRTDIAEIKELIRSQAQRQQQADLANEGRMVRLEAGIAEIKVDVAAINKRGEADHDEIVRMKSQLAVRPAVAAIASTTISLLAAYFGLRPHQ